MRFIGRRRRCRGRDVRRGLATARRHAGHQERIWLFGVARRVLVLAWFELEYPESVTQIDVWVTENLIRRIRVAAREAGSVTSSTTDFFDFGADIHIEPPA